MKTLSQALEVLTNSKMSTPVGLLLFFISLHLFRSGLKLLREGMSHDEASDSVKVIRGIRRGIFAIGTISFAGGIYYGILWPILFGLVLLFEEIIETGFMLLAVKSEE